jgi:hypothetical protein
MKRKDLVRPAWANGRQHTSPDGLDRPVHRWPLTVTRDEQADCRRVSRICVAEEWHAAAGQDRTVHADEAPVVTIHAGLGHRLVDGLDPRAGLASRQVPGMTQVLRRESHEPRPLPGRVHRGMSRCGRRLWTVRRREQEVRRQNDAFIRVSRSSNVIPTANRSSGEEQRPTTGVNTDAAAMPRTSVTRRRQVRRTAGAGRRRSTHQIRARGGASWTRAFIALRELGTTATDRPW